MLERNDSERVQYSASPGQSENDTVSNSTLKSTLQLLQHCLEHVESIIFSLTEKCSLLPWWNFTSVLTYSQGPLYRLNAIKHKSRPANISNHKGLFKQSHTQPASPSS